MLKLCSYLSPVVANYFSSLHLFPSLTADQQTTANKSPSVALVIFIVSYTLNIQIHITTPSTRTIQRVKTPCLSSYSVAPSVPRLNSPQYLSPSQPLQRTHAHIMKQYYKTRCHTLDSIQSPLRGKPHALQTRCTTKINTNILWPLHRHHDCRAISTTPKRPAKPSKSRLVPLPLLSDARGQIVRSTRGFPGGECVQVVECTVVWMRRVLLVIRTAEAVGEERQCGRCGRVPPLSRVDS